jgi:5-oxoprolinase (ATP-hydrolysing)
MRAMIDQDIPLNAGCLVPLTSTPSRAFITPNFAERLAQSSSRKIPSSPHHPKQQSAPETSSPRNESRMSVLKHSMRVLRVKGAVTSTSGFLVWWICVDLRSLSFGSGGKDPVTGEVKKGWGYYEVWLWFCGLDVGLCLIDYCWWKWRRTDVGWCVWCSVSRACE